MRLISLALRGYRNIASAALEFSPGINVLAGDNANGKTNAMEAAFYFAQGKSFRTSNPGEVIAFGSGGCRAEITYESPAGKINAMKMELPREGPRVLVKNGARAEKTADFIGGFRAVLFTPDHLSLIKSGPEQRRKFADMALSQIKPLYLSVLSESARVLFQRNHLLRQIKSRGESPSAAEQLSLWTQRYAKCAAAITRYRGEYAERLAKYAPDFFAGISGGRERLGIRYASSIGYAENHGDARACEAAYLALFEGARREEISAGTTLYGPQRDDVSIEVNGMSARSLASQGQQRSAALSLKLAEGEVSRAAHGEYPVFLLDDVLSELDGERQAYILKSLSDRQIIISCCDAGPFGGSRVIRVRNGEFF